MDEGIGPDAHPEAQMDGLILILAWVFPAVYELFPTVYDVHRWILLVHR
jgi:hypothetical protein